MTALVFIFAPAFTALFGILFASIVALRPPELPLSVRVPQAHANDAVIGNAIRRFRWSLALAWVATAALTTVLTVTHQTPLAAVAPVLLYAALSILALVLSRQVILRAKHDNYWFEGLPGRVSAQITSPEYHHPPVIWPALAGIVLAVATAVDVALYPTLPDPKSVWRFFGALMIGAMVVVLLTVLSIVAAHYSARTQPDDNAEQAALRTRVQRSMLSALLAELSFVIAVGIAAIELARRLAPGVTWATTAGGIGLALLVMVVVISAVARGRVQLRPANVRDPRSLRPDAVDDDQHWKGGLLYVNRDDPTLVVPRRFGLGWTLNLGRPGGVALTILLLLVIAGAVTAIILTAHAR